MVLTAKIPRYRQRLDCALFMKGFAHDADFLSGKLRLVDKARKEVRTVFVFLYLRLTVLL